MFSIVSLLLLVLSVYFSLANRCAPFQYIPGTDIWKNTTCTLNPSSNWNEASQSVKFAYDNPSFFDWLQTCDSQDKGIESLELGGTPLEVLLQLVTQRFGNNTLAICDKETEKELEECPEDSPGLNLLMPQQLQEPREEP